jgi:hypothetical protein
MLSAPPARSYSSPQLQLLTDTLRITRNADPRHQGGGDSLVLLDANDSGPQSSVISAHSPPSVLNDQAFRKLPGEELHQTIFAHPVDRVLAVPLVRCIPGVVMVVCVDGCRGKLLNMWNST